MYNLAFIDSCISRNVQVYISPQVTIKTAVPLNHQQGSGDKLRSF